MYPRIRHPNSASSANPSQGPLYSGFLYGYRRGDTAYIYPDFKTVLRGKFLEGTMVEARATKIEAFR